MGKEQGVDTPLDYIRRCGGASFSTKPFNEVDNLILSKLVCPDWTGCIPADGDAEGGITLRDASRAYFDARGARTDRLGVLISPEILPMIRLAAMTRRFGTVTLSGYVNHVDDECAVQFSAVCIDLDDGSRYIAYRGTDDTLAGWKENFNMSFLSAVPAQLEAVGYLEKHADGAPVRVGGHSKGGNLAVYAAAFSAPEAQERIIAVYNNDGPGFNTSMLQNEAYKRVRDRITTLVPQSSIVGMLLEHEEAYEVVKSGAIGPVQHDALTWEVRGDRFVHLESTTKHSHRLDRTLKAWVDSVDEPMRREFTDALFDILSASGAKTLTELTVDKLHTAHAMIWSYRRLSASQRGVLHRTVTLLWKAGRRSYGA